MGATYAVGGVLPLKFAIWREDYDPGDGDGARPGHVLYQAMPGETVHAGWLHLDEGRIGRVLQLGALVPGPKSKDAPNLPPDELIVGFNEGTPETAPEGHALRDAPEQPAPDIDPDAIGNEPPHDEAKPTANSPAVDPDALGEEPAGDPNDAESHVADLPVTGE